MLHDELVNLFLGAFAQTCIGLDLLDDIFQILDLIDSIVVHRMPVRLELAVLVPVTESKGGNIEYRCCLLDAYEEFCHKM